MKKEFSLYLDLVRFFAAILVVLYHSANIYNPGGLFFQLGHEAVIIFFVLSGYVIAFVSDTKEKTLKEYTASRASRLYSVALPAVILTFLLDKIGTAVSPEAYGDGYTALDYSFLRAIIGLVFINEFWTSIQIFSNVPYWSLSYEAWYYISFASLTYIDGKKRWVFLSLILILVGPKIIFLMPIWWIGVYIYRSKRLYLSSIQAICALLTSTIGIILFLYFDLSQAGWDILKEQIGSEAHKQLAFSRNVLSDYLLAILVATHFVAIRTLAPLFLTKLKVFSRPIRYFSAFTFAIYLFHQPILLFYKSIFSYEKITPGGYSLILLCTLISIWVLGHYTELKRPVYKRIILSLLESRHWARVPIFNSIVYSKKKDS